jgi:hypothetical protein
MTVAELIKELSTYRDDEVVFTQDLIPVKLIQAGGVPYIVDAFTAKDWVQED